MPDPQYQDLLDRVKSAFPQPTSDRVHDAYFVFTIMKALDSLDQLKSDRPYLGERHPLDYRRAQDRRFPLPMGDMENTISEVLTYLEGLMIWGHPNTQENVVPPTTIPSIVGNLFASIYNPNLIWDAYSHRVAQAEVECVSMVSDLIGYSPRQAGGLFTFGGTGANLYGVRIGLQKAAPGSLETGVREPVKLLCSDHAHYSKLNVAAWLGIGTDNVISVATDERDEIRIDALEQAARQTIEAGHRIVALFATLGTTDTFGVDDLPAVIDLRNRLVQEYDLDYRPHVHADAAIGWIWSVFLDYDFEQNRLGLSPETLGGIQRNLPRLAALRDADSVGVDFHKMGYAPYPDSLFLCRDRRDLAHLAREQESMPYLYQYGHHKPGAYSLECSRSGGSALAALANILFLGKEGYRTLVGHTLEMTGQLRKRLGRYDFTHILNADNAGPSTVFRVYPFGENAEECRARESDPATAQEAIGSYNEFNRRVSDRILEEVHRGRGVALSITESPSGLEDADVPTLVVMKSFIISPFTDAAAVRTVAEEVLEAVVRCSAQEDDE